jgi:porin
MSKREKSAQVWMFTAAMLMASQCGLGSAVAEEGFASLHNVESTPSKLSIVDAAPALLPFFNNGPVFGTAGTAAGDLWQRTQVTGDWDGARSRLADEGLFVDLYSTSSYQDVTEGGLATGSSFVQNTQLSINVDTGRAGLWPGGLVHFTLQSRYGDNVAHTFNAGSAFPQYTGLVEPGPLEPNRTYPSELFLLQALSPKFFVMLGRISDVFIPDETLFGDSYKYYFSNFNFNKNPMTVNFYHPTANAALAAWLPARWLALAGGVLDPNTDSNNLATGAFDRVNLYAMAIVSYSIDGNPGQFGPAFNWSNQLQPDYRNPFGTLAPAQIPKAIGNLIGVTPATGLPVNSRDTSWFLIGNFSQYLYVTDSPEKVAADITSGEVINGVGIMGRFGFAPERTNLVTRDASIALFAHGIIPSRAYDSFGAGYYINQISDDLKDSAARLSGGLVRIKDEQGVEVFYDFALTPAIRVIPGYQYIWNPLTAKTALGQTSASVFQVRLTVTL